jgi:hypothetical protein
MMIGGWLKAWRTRRERLRSRRPRLAAARSYPNWAAECLEARALLSNIAVTTDNGVIRLSGDTGDHNFTAKVVTISSVQNLELAGSGGTEFTFGNTTAATIDIPLSTIGTIKGLDITMQGGADTIDFDGTNLGTISGDVNVQLGDGSNSLNFHNATVTGRMIVNGGSDADAITLGNDTLGALSVCSGDGSDSVSLSTVTINGVQTFSNLFDDDWMGSDHDWSDGSWDGFLNGLRDRFESLRHSLDGSLSIQTGNGNDTVSLTSVTGNSGEHSWGLWDCGDHLWSFGKQWRISVGSGTDSVTFDTVEVNQSVSVRGGSGNDTVTLGNSTFNARTSVSLSTGDDQINVNKSTFAGPVHLSTGPGDGQTISINDSTFQKFVTISDPGTNATVNLETAGTPGPGTTFQRSVLISVPGPSATVNFAAAGANNTLTFEEFVSIFGGNPAAAVNITTANTTLDDNKLFLFSADRNDV